MQFNPIGGAVTRPDPVTLRAADAGLPALSVDASAFRRMRGKAMVALNALPRRGMEIGGVLVGRVDVTTADSLAITIEDFVTFEISHEWGPSYRLAADELSGLQYRMQTAARGAGRGSAALGWWHTDTFGAPMQFRPEDEAVFHALGGVDPTLFLLFRPHPVFPFRCRIHVLEDGVIEAHGEFSVAFEQRLATASTGLLPARSGGLRERGALESLTVGRSRTHSAHRGCLSQEATISGESPETSAAPTPHRVPFSRSPGPWRRWKGSRQGSTDKGARSLAVRGFPRETPLGWGCA